MALLGDIVAMKPKTYLLQAYSHPTALPRNMETLNIKRVGWISDTTDLAIKSCSKSRMEGGNYSHWRPLA